MDNFDYYIKYRGCLLGGAIGDALGYAVEFLSESQIFDKYGARGITEYSLNNGVAEISDDTQMTLFTANALLLDEPDAMSHCYMEWRRTQGEKFPLDIKNKYSWLVNIPRMFHSRAPGITCLEAIAQGANGTMANPINKSKGCGGIMRVAPIGLYYGAKNNDIRKGDMVGAETAALTHGHELGYIPAAGLVHIVSLLAHSFEISIMDAVLDMKRALCEDFAKAKHLPELIALVDKAIELSQADMNDVEAINQLGEGWVAEETLAIAIYCALKYDHDFEKAIIASVNHKGDSDSTGAVTGNIVGAYIGNEWLPDKFSMGLELHDVIGTLADDLYIASMLDHPNGDNNKDWKEKYIDKTFDLYLNLNKHEEPEEPEGEAKVLEDSGKPEGEAEHGAEEYAAEVIMFPDFQKLKDEVAKLRTELSMIILERDELQLVTCQNIETAYMLELGALEYKLYEAQCNAARLKRKIDLIQAKINQQKKVILPEIEKSLDIEFEEYQEKLNEQMAKMNEAISHSKCEPLSEKDGKELKSLYRKVVKALHPDIHPNVTAEELQLFGNAVMAYESGDVSTLRIIDEMVGNHSLPDDEGDATSQLLKEKKRIEKIIEDVRNRVASIKEEFPYSMKEILEDPDKLAEKKVEFEEQLKEYNDTIEAYQERLQKMLGE